MPDRFTVLVVCQANVCRSPAAERLLARWTGQVGLGDLIRVESAGWDAQTGADACAAARVWMAERGDGTSRDLTEGQLARADLVLAVDRAARDACVRLSPACRPRLVTVTQAGFLADRLGRQLAAGESIPGAPSIPDAPAERLRWLVSEIDAARGLLAGRDEASDDIVDAHGADPHMEVFDRLNAALAPLVRAWVTCAGRMRHWGL